MKSLAQLAQYTRTPILDDGSDVIQWWNDISPAERLQVVRNVMTTTALDDLGSEPTYIQQRILVPSDRDGIEKLEKFRRLKPEQRLLLLKQFHQE